MSKLLVNTPSGKQELIEVREGGAYFDPLRVLWDERTDGDLPVITLGGMTRMGDVLAFSQSRMDEHAAATRSSDDDSHDDAIEIELQSIDRLAMRALLLDDRPAIAALKGQALTLIARRKRPR